jgi:hypothetical protein
MISNDNPKLTRQFVEADPAEPLWLEDRGLPGDDRLGEVEPIRAGRDGHFTGFEPLVCGDDAEAIEPAERLVG